MINGDVIADLAIFEPGDVRRNREQTLRSVRGQEDGMPWSVQTF